MERRRRGARPGRRRAAERPRPRWSHHPGRPAGLELLSEDETLPAVVHCTAGKDRTGVLVALLLDLLGVAREQIVADYAATTDNMPGILDRIRSSSFFQGNGLAAAPAWIFES